jgi:site-specific recombinase XerD
MHILDFYKSMLLQDKNHPSNITVKNYVTDLRKFISWYENKFHISFDPRRVTSSTLHSYKNELIKMNPEDKEVITSPRSAKRYLSSLNKFFSILNKEGIITENPCNAIRQETKEKDEDKWNLLTFKNYLLLSKSSKVTIKNYLADLRHFFFWIEKTMPLQNEKIPLRNQLYKITPIIINEYKNRLLYEAQLSPRSINRKLSSLRKYLQWAEKYNFIAQAPPIEQVSLEKIKQNIQFPISTKKNALLNKSEQPQITNKSKKIQQKKEYSSFPPFRLAQKATKGINLFLNLLIFSPFAALATQIAYLFWKTSGANVFVPVEQIAKENLAQKITEQTVIKKSPLDTLLQSNILSLKVENLPKSFYAPLQISTTNIPFRKKIIFHLKHTRPLWYKKYHSYSFTHYLHFTILLLVISLIGFRIYNSIYERSQDTAVLAALPHSPPRMLAFQGKLTDATNTPIATEKTLRFALYSDETATGSAMLWQEVQTLQPNDQGEFTTYLGSNIPLTQAILTENPKLFLGISIGENTELLPRQQIATTDQATNTEKVQGLSPITDPNAGTKNVILALDSTGNLTIGGNASPTFAATGGEFTLSGKTLTLTTTEGSNTNIQINPDGTGIIDLQKPIQNTTNSINLPGITGAIELQDSVAIVATTSTQPAFIINQNGTGNLISASTSGIAKFNLDYEGNAFFDGNINMNGNKLTTTRNTFELFNTNVMNLAIGNNASSISLGAGHGTTTINNDLFIRGISTMKSALNVSGLLTANRGIAIPEGQNFMVGTTEPAYRIDIQGEETGKAITQIYNKNTSDDADGLIIKLGNKNNTIATNNHFIDFATDGLGIVGSIRGNGTKGIQVTNAGFADWAEYLPKDQETTIPFGSIVCINQNGKTYLCNENENNIIGVASENPSFIAGENKEDQSIAVGMLGIIKTRVSTQNGVIVPGDFITSSLSGIGVKAVKPGFVIGRALEGYTANSSTRSILVSVQSSWWYDPNISITTAGNMQYKKKIISSESSEEKKSTTGLIRSIISNIKLGAIETESITTKSFTITSEKILIGSKTMKDYIAEIVTETIKNEQTQKNKQTADSNVINPLASESATVTAIPSSPTPTIPMEDNAQTTSSAIQASSEAELLLSLTPIPMPIATKSAGQKFTLPSEPTITPSHYASLSGELIPTLESNFAQFNEGIIALGASSLTDTTINGELTLGNSMILADNSINAIGTTLELQSLRQGDLSIMDGLVKIDTEGNLEVTGNATFAHDVLIKGSLATNLIKPIPDEDIIIKLDDSNKSNEGSKIAIQNGKKEQVLTINKNGDILASGTGQFANLATNALTIIRGVQADTSLTETVASGSAGTITITANETERTIKNSFVTDKSLIYLSPVSNTWGVTPYIARQTSTNSKQGTIGSFTIQIPNSVTKDIELNWWIVN